MADALVGDDVFDDDPTVHKLERYGTSGTRCLCSDPLPKLATR